MTQIVTGYFFDMGRRSHIRMKVLDFKVIDETTARIDESTGKKIITKTGHQLGVVSVQIRKSKYTFNKAYGIKVDEIKTFDWEIFKERIYQDAQKLIMDKDFESAALRKIDEFIGIEIMLD